MCCRKTYRRVAEEISVPPVTDVGFIAEIVQELLKMLERYLNVGYRNRDFNASLATYLATLSSHHLDGKRARGQKKEFCSDGVLVRRFRRERRIFYQKNTNFACPPSVVRQRCRKCKNQGCDEARPTKGTSPLASPTTSSVVCSQQIDQGS